jgi:hypothetical protein
MPAGFQCLAGCIISWLTTNTRNAPPEVQVAAIDLNRHHAPKVVQVEPPLPINFGARGKQNAPPISSGAIERKRTLCYQAL